MALDIQIGKYKITNDAQNIILLEKKTVKEGDNTGQEYFATIGYYGKIEDAAKRIIDQEIKASDCKSLKEVVLLIQQVKKDIDLSLNY